MLTISAPPDYLLCLHCGFAGWTGCWLQCCPECRSPIPGSTPGGGLPEALQRAAAPRPPAPRTRDAPRRGTKSRR